MPIARDGLCRFAIDVRVTRHPELPPVMDCPWVRLESDCTGMRSRSAKGLQCSKNRLSFDYTNSEVSLMNSLQIDSNGTLTELVAFKWLMAGRGWWVDLPRFRSDAVYARECAQKGAESGLELLARSSASLLAQMQRPTLQGS